MNHDRLASLLLETLILGVVITILLASLADPSAKDLTMPQTITHTLPGGSVTTPRRHDETLRDWLDRHKEALAAATS